MTTTTYEPAEMTASLVRHVGDRNTHKAALELLVEHDYWMHRIVYHHPQFVHDDDGIPFRLDWIELAKAFDRGELRAGSWAMSARPGAGRTPRRSCAPSPPQPGTATSLLLSEKLCHILFSLVTGYEGW
ncbi:hypothetical protein [Streptomyces cellulosae]|uniref:hypothetical protein n=1 Tax=Streptomyces cellulosae TaxID=1968 RepID=UPI0004C69026|nr:hypothetical protein [Streptomyces cellulosae]